MKTTVHHLFPKNGVDGRGKNTEINKVLLPEHIHINHHRIFGNLEFHYQVLRVLEFNQQVVQRHVLREVANIMGDDLSYIYKNGVFTPRIF